MPVLQAHTQQKKRDRTKIISVIWASQLCKNEQEGGNKNGDAAILWTEKLSFPILGVTAFSVFLRIQSVVRIKRWPMESNMPRAALSILAPSNFFFLPLSWSGIYKCSVPGTLTAHAVCPCVRASRAAPCHTRRVRCSKASAGPLLSPSVLPPRLSLPPFLSRAR